MHANRFTQGAREYDVKMTVTDTRGRAINADEHSVVWARTERQARLNAIDETWNAYMGDVLIDVTNVTRI